MEGYATLFTVMRLSVRYYLSIDDYNRNYISGDHVRETRSIFARSPQDKTARIALSNRYTTGGEFPLLERVEFVIGAKSIRPDAGALSSSIRNTDKNGLIIIHSPP